jgi:hypothetical protein
VLREFVGRRLKHSGKNFAKKKDEDGAAPDHGKAYRQGLFVFFIGLVLIHPTFTHPTRK